MPAIGSRLESRLQAVEAWYRLKAGLQTQRTDSQLSFQTHSKSGGQSVPGSVRSLLSFLALLVSLMPLAGAETTSTNESASSTALVATTVEPLDDKQALALGDRVSFRILEEPEEPKILTVADSGELEVPYIGRVQAADKTCRALAVEIKALLEKDYYYQATVVLAVDLLSKNRGRVYVFGQLRGSGPLDLLNDEVLTLSKAILRAGGFSDFADRRHVRLTRKSGQTFMVDVAEILEKGRAEKDQKLQPDDLIYVPSRLVNF
ncbi:MAG: polysaccharide biosynthesis/export family protein [Verrucomicrobiales bacterium]|nr:polysaccharide biosynthesis/export family protein [Verrucomicrobiales bacterium]